MVDISETAGLPDKIKTAYRTGGAATPIVIFTDPAIVGSFGRFDYPAMKSQKYGTIFKPAKDLINKAKKEGTFRNGGKAPVVVKVEGTVIDSWKSSVGTEIKARLVGVEDNTIYIFQTAAGKTIRATAKQLDKASVAKARKLAKLKD